MSNPDKLAEILDNDELPVGKGGKQITLSSHAERALSLVQLHLREHPMWMHGGSRSVLIEFLCHAFMHEDELTFNAFKPRTARPGRPMDYVGEKTTSDTVRASRINRAAMEAEGPPMTLKDIAEAMRAGLPVSSKQRREALEAAKAEKRAQK